MNPTIHPIVVARTMRTAGVTVLLVLVALGLLGTGYRFFFGLGPSTHLNQSYPWGIWKVINVAAGIAIGAGGFTTAAFVYVFRRNSFQAIARPALLAAALCYTFAVIGLVIDLGRYYNIWHPILPSMWQPDSILFEIAMCVMSYLTVLYLEFAPVVCERLSGDVRRPRLARVCEQVKNILERIMFLFILAGVVISCLHQSSLGNLMVLAPSKMHILWHTPILSLLFLLSAIAVGFPMVIGVSIYAAWALKLEPQVRLLSQLARYVPPLLGVYLAFKIGDLVLRDAYPALFKTDSQAIMFILEIVVGVLLPMGLFLSPSVRNSVLGLFSGAMLVIVGVVMNRVDVFLVAYRPPYASGIYVPSIVELIVTVGLIAAIILLYRVIASYLPILSRPSEGLLS